MRTEQEIREEIKRDCEAADTQHYVLLIYQQRQLELMFDIRDLLAKQQRIEIIGMQTDI